MIEKIIPIIDHRAQLGLPILPSDQTVAGQLVDTRGRLLKDLRISVTDRCNFRCVYCMPKELFDKNYSFLPHTSLLSFEEITRLARLFVAQGVEKIRLTGGEPLLRKHLENLIAMLADIETPEGKALDLTLTTNGSLLAKKARMLRAAGLQRVTVSLDALDNTIFQQMNDVDFPVADVLRGLDAAHEAGLAPIKVNMVVKAGVNESQIIPMAKYFKNTPFSLRFIEYMDVGNSNGWRMDEVVSSQRIVEQIHACMPLTPLVSDQPGETARRWRYQDGTAEIGLISSVTHAFCSSCMRARLSTEGRLFNCLFAHQGYDLRALLRNGSTDADITQAIAGIWQNRTDRYSELRTLDTENAAFAKPKVEMSYIGG